MEQAANPAFAVECLGHAVLFVEVVQKIEHHGPTGGRFDAVYEDVKFVKKRLATRTPGTISAELEVDNRGQGVGVRRYGAKEIVGLVRYLLSDAAKYITGQTYFLRTPK